MGSLELIRKQRPVLIIAGPTGVGKSDIAVKLAHILNGEVISADSVAVYRGLDIGSAKPSLNDMDGIPHHLIDVLDPDEYFGVDEFVKLAREAMNGIWSRGRLPIITGGTGFYIQALLYDIDFDDESAKDEGYRESLYEIADLKDGKQKLYEMLSDIDPEYANSVHPNNVKRVIRALEYNKNTGRLFSEMNKEQRNRVSPYDHCYVALDLDRDRLYERIDKRVDIMLKNGLIDEVKGLMESGYGADLNSMSSIGYKEMVAYLEGRCSYDDAVEDIKKNSRHYAKRQFTWLKREKDVTYIKRDPDDPEDEEIIIKQIIDLMTDKGILA